MTRTEERLTDALAARAAAVAADSIRPLPAPEFGPFRRHLAGRRWSVSLAPLAAAASIATITAIVMLPHHRVPGPALTSMPKNSSLLGVAAVSATDAWAVGLVIAGRRTLPLIMHWNGTHWTRSSIATGVRSQFLRGVAAGSARDAWAVGAGAKGPHAYILHWNGATWAPVPTPRTSAPAELSAVTVVSEADAWAVGQANGALILHWNGTKWRIVPNPWRGGDIALYGVSARSADDAWAVGKTGSSALILHWNGISWARLRAPKYGRWGSYSVAAVSPQLTWLVGRTKKGLPLILRWNGSTLRRLPTPKPTVRGGLTGVSAVSAGQAWAVGSGGFRGGRSQTLIFRWQGHAWLRVPSPARRLAGNPLGVFALSAKNAWAVGYTGFAIGIRSRGFILHWNGTAWQAVA